MITQTLDRDDPVLGATHPLAERLAQRLEWLDVLQLWAGRCALPPNTRVASMGKERGAGRAARLAALVRAVRALVTRGDVDLVFAHMAPLYAIAAAPLVRPAGVPTVLWYAHRHVSPALRLATALSARVVSPTADAFRLPTRKLRLVGHGIDTDLFRAAAPLPTDTPPRVLTAGRISPIKDLETYVRAARLVLERAPDAGVRFAIRGGTTGAEDERYLAGLRRLVSSLGLDATLEILPPLPYRQMPAAYAACDVHVNLAPRGAPDKAVLEAMACERLPLVCNATFAPLFGADAGRCLFRERDPDDLAARLLDWLAAPAEARQAAGRRLRASVAREQSVDVQADRLLAVFREVLVG